MKSTIRTFVLATIALATGLASTHTASAQIYSRNTSSNYQLQSGGYITVNAVIIGPGNYSVGGQQTIGNQGSSPVYVYCWVSTAANSSSELPYGLISSATIPPSAWTTLSFYGWYGGGASELYVNCRATDPSGEVLATTGNITAAYVP